jgi:hypothetical protein
MSAVLQQLVSQPYKHGFVTDIESETAPRGLSEDVIRMISAKKGEPDWLLQFRLEAYRHWLTMTEPTWQNVSHPPIDYQDIIYYSAPKPKKKLASMDEVDPELLKTFEKLGVPMHERASLAGVAVDVIFDSVSVATTYKAKLAEVVKSVEKSLPLDTNPATESFNATPRRALPEAPLDPSLPSVRDRVREHFGMNGGGGDDSKLDRILRLIEQNRTGYAPATTQDMLLYIATGVFFLFTFDTFVTLGKAMRGR